jgi:hypothetical protein
MAQQLSEREVGRGLIVLGVDSLLALLPFPYARLVAAGVVAVAGLFVLIARPLGNRLLGVGVLLMAVLLVVAARAFPLFSGMLTILIAVLLSVAGLLKLKGHW